MINKIKKTFQSADELDSVKEAVKEVATNINSTKKTILELQRTFEKKTRRN